MLEVALYQMGAGLWTTTYGRSEQVPQKVLIFAWRLSQGELATQSNRKQRTLTRKATCQICVAGDEDGHHAVVFWPEHFHMN
jgi:hypothetical protein